MAFTVPVGTPAPPTNLNAGDYIQANDMIQVVRRDRFVFGVRRRLIASLGKVMTTSSASYQVAYGLQAQLLPTSNGTILIGVTADEDCTVRVTTSYGSAAVSTGGPGCYIGSITSIPTSTWFGITVEVVSNIGSPVTIYGIYIAEAVLTAADLP